MRMRLLVLLFIPLLCNAQGVNIIPKPQAVKILPGLFSFSNGLSIKTYVDDVEVSNIARLMAQRIFTSTEWKAPESKTGAKNVVLQLLPAQKDSDTDASYVLRIETDSVIIQSHTYRGLFYGSQSAAQLFINSVLTYQVPCLEIKDYPAYDYRGMELDVCRHFYGKEVVKQYIDLLAALKMNFFHWHLTDDQGWRIEIKKYPRLTEVGAWRTEKDGSRYGGFYTQDDVKEIVAYAAERYVTVVPEVELPGHSQAAIAAYLWLSCYPNQTKAVSSTWGIKQDIYCPGDSTFMFLKDVMDEICALFPGPYIHLGGDEVPKKAWKQSGAAQAIIKQQHLKDEEELQHYFLTQIEKYLAGKGKRCIGWGEIVKGGLNKNTIVMSWMNKSAGIKAAQNGNGVIMAPRAYCYFDYPQKLTDKRGAWWMLYLPLKKAYAFTPMSNAIPIEYQRNILGGQANVWTEYITNEKELQYHIVPRIAALAEALWNKHKDFDSFKQRLQTGLSQFKARYR